MLKRVIDVKIGDTVTLFDEASSRPMVKVINDVQQTRDQVGNVILTFNGGNQVLPGINQVEVANFYA